jgi:hypothetical protein
MATSLLILVCSPDPYSFKTRIENAKGSKPVIQPVPETAANPNTMF